MPVVCWGGHEMCDVVVVVGAGRRGGGEGGSALLKTRTDHRGVEGRNGQQNY